MPSLRLCGRVPCAQPGRSGTSDPPEQSWRRIHEPGEHHRSARFIPAGAGAQSIADCRAADEGIALIQAQRLGEARDALLDATRRQPQSARRWYNLGLAYRTLGESDSAVDPFERVAQINPNDADTLYFIGQLHLQSARHDQAVATFLRALALDTRHASAEFGLARAYQLSGNATAAAQHLARFDQLSQSKLGKPISSVYGEQGPYSTAEAIAGEDPVPSDFSVRFVIDTRAGLRFEVPKPSSPERIVEQLGSGACFTDFDNDGRPDLVLLGGARHAVLYRNSGGRFNDVTSRAGLIVTKQAFGCTAGDYDNDGRDDIAIGLEDGLAVFRNQGNGTFRDVTSTLGIRSGGIALGLSFVDYDHDGDLDLYVPRLRFPACADCRVEFPSPVKAPANALCRNNGNGSFVDATDEAGVAGDAPGVGVVAADLDNDRAVDFLTWMRDSVHPSRPNATICCCFSWSKTLLMPA